MEIFRKIAIILLLTILPCNLFASQSIGKDVVEIKSAEFGEVGESWLLVIVYRINDGEWVKQSSDGNGPQPHIKLRGTTVEIIRDLEWVFEETSWVFQCEPNTAIKWDK